MAQEWTGTNQHQCVRNLTWISRADLNSCTSAKGYCYGSAPGKADENYN